MEILLLCAATGTAVRETLTGVGSDGAESGTVMSLHVVSCDLTLLV
jgi:hypothetical protein